MERNKFTCAARGCDGCKVCAAHSEDASQMVPSASAQLAEPIYQVQMADGSWIDQAEHNHRFNLQFVSNKVRIVYAAPAPSAPPADHSGDSADMVASASPARVEDRTVYDCSTADCQCDACRIERGETGPFNDVEPAEPARASRQGVAPCAPARRDRDG